MDNATSGPTGPKGRGPSKFTLTDLRRAMRAARKEDMRVRIDILPDRISIVPLIEDTAALPKGATGPNEWDSVLP